MEIAVRGIDEIGITGDTTGLRSAGTYFDGRIENKAIVHVGIGTIDCETVGVVAFGGVHEDTVGDVRVVEVGGIDATGVRRMIEGAMVYKDSTGDRSKVGTAIQVDKTAGTVAAVEGAAGDGDRTELVGRIGRIDGTSSVGCSTEAEETIVDGEVKECISGHDTQYIGGSLDGYTPKREIRFYFHTGRELEDRLGAFGSADSKRHSGAKGRRLGIFAVYQDQLISGCRIIDRRFKGTRTRSHIDGCSLKVHRAQERANNYGNKDAFHIAFWIVHQQPECDRAADVKIIRFGSVGLNRIYASTCATILEAGAALYGCDNYIAEGRSTERNGVRGWYIIMLFHNSYYFIVY